MTSTTSDLRSPGNLALFGLYLYTPSQTVTYTAPRAGRVCSYCPDVIPIVFVLVADNALQDTLVHLVPRLENTLVSFHKTPLVI